MDLFDILTLIGGLSLFLFGMEKTKREGYGEWIYLTF